MTELSIYGLFNTDFEGPPDPGDGIEAIVDFVEDAYAEPRGIQPIPRGRRHHRNVGIWRRSRPNTTITGPLS